MRLHKYTYMLTYLLTFFLTQLTHSLTHTPNSSKQAHAQTRTFHRVGCDAEGRRANDNVNKSVITACEGTTERRQRNDNQRLSRPPAPPSLLGPSTESKEGMGVNGGVPYPSGH